MKTGNLSSLHFVAKNNPRYFKSCLLALPRSPWQGLDAGAFENLYHGIHAAIGEPGLSRFFNLYLISAFLMDQDPPPWVKSLISSRINIENDLGISADQFATSTWQSVPVLLAGENHAHIRTFMVGRLTCGPDPGLVPQWAHPLFDPKALESARTALDFVTSHSAGQTMTSDQGHFIFYPLTPANSNQVQFKGGSASLALALGFKSLLKGTPISNKLICTGVVTGNGRIKWVGSLGKKYSIFERNRALSCLLYPVSNRINDQDKRCIPVETFDQAWMIAHLYSEKHQNKLFLLTRILDNPKYFVDHLTTLPWEWVSWINQEKKALGLLHSIVEDPGLLKTFTKKFESIVENGFTDQAAAISELITDSMLNRIDRKTPLSALRWYTANLSLANHLGQVKHPLEWEQRGMALADRVRHLDSDLVATFFNHCLVTSHNRFHFTPALPLSLERTLSFLQARYKNECNFGCTINLVLGRLYGTLMQHYAFCGPGYIQESEAYGKKALTALGADLDFENKEEWIRQYCYLTYARLDAGNITGAQKSLEQYLEIKKTDPLTRSAGLPFSPDKLSCWQLALVCRFFAQVKDHPLGQAVYDQILSMIDVMVEPAHPWQLCTYNLGRMALDSGDEKNARLLLKKSLEICLSKKSGPTIQVMALLPLSLLADLYEHTNSKDDNQIMEQAKQKILTASSQLNGPHFAFLQETSFETALVRVRKTPGAVFPFSYR